MCSITFNITIAEYWPPLARKFSVEATLKVLTLPNSRVFHLLFADVEIQEISVALLL
jgi:hypothetical protein